MSLDKKLKQKLKGFRYVEGMRYPYPLGSLIIYGKKSLSLHKKRIERWQNQPLLLVENGYALGVIKLYDEAELTPGVARRLLDQAQMLESEFDAWNGDATTIWAYKIKVLDKLERPYPIKVPDDAFLWIRPNNIEFSKDKFNEVIPLFYSLFKNRMLPDPFGRPEGYRNAFIAFADWLSNQPVPEELLDFKNLILAEASMLLHGILFLDPTELEELSNQELVDLYEMLSNITLNEEVQVLMNFVSDELKRRNVAFARKKLPVPSEKEGEPVVTADEVLDALNGEAILYERAVCLVGSLVNEGKGKDIDILVRQEVPSPVFRRIAVRLGRPLSKLGYKVQIIRDDGPISSYIPLYDIVLVPSPYRDSVVEMAKNKAVKPLHWIPTMKPVRIGGGEHQTIERFLALVEKHGPVGLLEPKVDGDHIQLHYTTKHGWKVFSDQGTDITRTVIDVLKDYEPEHDIVLEGELEIWRNGKHMPRELTSGQLHRGIHDPGFRITVWDCLYCDEDIHHLGAKERYEALLKLGKELKIPVASPPKAKLNILPVYEVNSISAVKKKTEQLIKHHYLEGVVWKKLDGQYYLDGNPRGTQVKWHRNVVIRATVVGKKETKTKGIYIYTWGVQTDDERFHPAIEVNGKRYHVCGKTFGTALKYNIGDEIDIEFEGVTLTKKKGKLAITGYAPKIVTIKR